MAELKRAETGVMVPPEDRASIRFFEGIVFTLRAKGPSADDNTIRQRIGRLSDDLGGRGDFFTAHAKDYLRCFQPVEGGAPTLLDQVGPTLERMNTRDQREVLEYLVHDATKSIVKQRRPRPAKTGRSDVTEGTRGVASEFANKLENHILERLDPTPVPGATQFDRFVRASVRLGESVALVQLASNLGACTPIRPTISPDATPPAIIQTVPGMPTTPAPTEFRPTLTPSGPETTPNAAHPYPASLSVETATQGMAAVEDAPASITGLPDVQTIVAKHTQLARDAGLAFDHMAVQYVPAEQRWFLVPVAADGTTIAGWLQIADPSSLSGFRYGEQPTWDSNYSPRTDTYHYGLPALHDPANHFVVGFANGFPVLIEVTPDDKPQYWNDVVEKTTMLVEGAVLPTETPMVIEPGNQAPYRVEAAADLSNLPAALAPYREKLLQAGKIVNLYPPGGIEGGNPYVPGEYVYLYFDNNDSVKNLINNTVYLQLIIKDPVTSETTTYDGMYGLFSRQGKTTPVDLLFLEQTGLGSTIADLRSKQNTNFVSLMISIPPAGKEVKTAAACAGDPQPVVCRFGTSPVGDSLPVFFSTASDESSPIVVANLLQEFNELFGEGKRVIVIAALGGQ